MDVSELKESLKGGLGIVLALLLAGIIVGLVMFFVGVFNNKGDEAKSIIDSADKARFEKFDNNIAKGSDLISFMDVNKDGNYGVIVITKGNSEGVNYLRPIVAEGADVGTAPEVNADSHGYPNAFTGASADELAKSNYLKGQIASDDYNARALNLKNTKRAGNKYYINPNGHFDCKLIEQSGKIIGIYCKQQGTDK